MKENTKKIISISGVIGLTILLVLTFNNFKISKESEIKNLKKENSLLIEKSRKVEELNVKLNLKISKL